MNETSATSASSASGLSLLPEGIATLTAIHFAIIAVLAALVILGLVWGIRAKRSRVQASREVTEHAAEAGVPHEPASPAAEPAVEAPVEPVAERTAEPTPPARVPVDPTQAQSQTRAPVAPPVVTPPVVDTPIVAPPVVDTPVADTPPADTAPDRPVDAPIASPAKEAAPAAPAPDYAADPVTQLKGLGPKVAARLAELGVTTIGEMAALSPSAAQAIDTQLGAFTGRMQRDRWIEQARLLAAGDKAGFEAVFGKL